MPTLYLTRHTSAPHEHTASLLFGEELPRQRALFGCSVGCAPGAPVSELFQGLGSESALSEWKSMGVHEEGH